MCSVSCVVKTRHRLSHLQPDQAFNEQMQEYAKSRASRRKLSQGSKKKDPGSVSLFFSRLPVIGKMELTLSKAVNYINDQLCAHQSPCDGKTLFQWCLNFSYLSYFTRKKRKWEKMGEKYSDDAKK